MDPIIRLASIAISNMIENWMCDGCPNGNSSDSYDEKVVEKEAARMGFLQATNEIVLIQLVAALAQLEQRTADRKARNVEPGQSTKHKAETKTNRPGDSRNGSGSFRVDKDKAEINKAESRKQKVDVRTRK